MTDLPKSQRPREKMSAFGLSNLSNAEILAILINSGHQKQNALSIARKILSSYSLQEISLLKPYQLSQIKGIGPVKADRILASLEFGRRLNFNKTLMISKPGHVLPIISSIRQKNREYLIALYCNARHELIKKQTITIGGLNINFLEPRDVFSPAITLPCTEIFLVHNHPSGDPRPSQNDLVMTQTLAEAGKLLGIRLVDHIIVSDKDYFSFREQRII